MKYLLYMILISGFFTFVMFVRNNIIFMIRSKAIDIIYDNYEYFEMYGFSLLDNPGYIRMLFDLKKWTFKQFYPMLTIKEKDNV